MISRYYINSALKIIWEKCTRSSGAFNIFNCGST